VIPVEEMVEEELNALVGFAEVQERERRYTPKAAPARDEQER
jgi:hypothetical protein